MQNGASLPAGGAISREEIFPGIYMCCYREDAVLETLLEWSAAFSAFYEYEREAVTSPVKWYLDGELPKDIGCTCRIAERGPHMMRVREVPLPPAWGFGVAHELSRLSLREKGFPVVHGISPFDGLCRVMNEMLHDMLINPLLRKYGFDPMARLRGRIDIERMNLRKRRNIQEDSISRLQRTFEFAAMLLQQDIFPTSFELDEKYRSLHDRAFPGVAEEARSIIEIVNKTGVESPEKLDKTYRLLIGRYGMENIVSSIHSLER